MKLNKLIMIALMSFAAGTTVVKAEPKCSHQSKMSLFASTAVRVNHQTGRSGGSAGPTHIMGNGAVR